MARRSLTAAALGAALLLPLGVASAARADPHLKACNSGGYVGRVAVKATYWGYMVDWYMVDAPGYSAITMHMSGRPTVSRSSAGSVIGSASFTGAPSSSWYMTADTSYTSPCRDDD